MFSISIYLFPKSIDVKSFGLGAEYIDMFRDKRKKRKKKRIIKKLRGNSLKFKLNYVKVLIPK